MSSGLTQKLGNLFGKAARAMALLGTVGGAAALPACGPAENEEPVGTAQSALSTVGITTPFSPQPAGAPITWMHEHINVPNLPLNPSNETFMHQVFQINNENVSNAIYFELSRRGKNTVPYEAEVTVRKDFVQTNGFLHVNVRPGDEIDFVYNATGSGGSAPYVQITRTTAPAFNIAANISFTPGTQQPNSYVIPYLGWVVDTATERTPAGFITHNCATDMPAGNPKTKVAEIDLVTQYFDGATRDTLPVGQASVAGSQASLLNPPKCNVSISSVLTPAGRINKILSSAGPL